MRSEPRIWVDYRPVRIGWVVPDRDIARLATAATWNSCLWGGRFNPIIPIDDLALADRLVKTFAVDVLIPVEGTDTTRAFIGRFPHLGHSRWREPIFERRQCEFADVRHIVRRIFRQQDKQVESALVLPVWSQMDALHPMLSITFGQYPRRTTTLRTTKPEFIKRSTCQRRPSQATARCPRDYSTESPRLRSLDTT